MAHARRLTCLLVAVLLCGGCSLVYDFTECSTDSDCQGLTASAGSTYECRSNQCVLVSSGDTSGMDVSDTNMSDADTPDTSMEDTTPPLTCTLHSECQTRFGEDFLCGAGGECLAMTQATCKPELVPASADIDSLVVLGSILPILPPFDTIGEPFRNSVELAVREYNFAVSDGFPSLSQVLWVNCESRGESTTGVAAAEHLKALGAPAMVGPVVSEVFGNVVEQVTRDAQIFSISPSATAPSLSTLDDNGFAWQIIPPDFYQANAIIDRVSSTELGEKTLNKEKVIIFNKGDLYGTELKGLIQPEIEARIGEENVFVYEYADPASFDFDEALVTQELTSVVLQALGENTDADAAVLIGTTETPGLALIYMQALGQMGETLPADFNFLISHGGVASSPEITDAVGDSALNVVEGFSARVLDEQNFFAFGLRYQAQFMNETPITTAPLSYDATMVALLAMATIPAVNEVTGAGIKAGVPKLADKTGVAVSFGDNDFLANGIDILTQGGTIDIKGVSGELDFNPLGETRTDMVGWDLAKLQEDPPVYTINPRRIYSLNPIPAQDGFWVELCTVGTSPRDALCTESPIDICIMPDGVTPPPVCAPVQCDGVAPCPQFRSCGVAVPGFCDRAEPCMIDADCSTPANAVCEGNLCVAIPCATNGDCPSGRTCDIGGTDHCQPSS